MTLARSMRAGARVEQSPLLRDLGSKAFLPLILLVRVYGRAGTPSSDIGV
tara:strand:+ start:42 stop:191 length:150 start_codon:yes stop_codon:yes gene_type:complete